MPPPFPIDDQNDCCLTDFEELSQFTHQIVSSCVEVANLAYLIVSQFSGSVLLSLCCRAVPKFVSCIFRKCSPADVFQAAISSVSIKVSAFLSFRARTDEGYKDKIVNVKRCQDIIFVKLHHVIALLADLRLSDLSQPSTFSAVLERNGSRERPDSSLGRSLIQIFISGNVLPDFGHFLFPSVEVIQVT